jgi:hypothetical protein
VDTSCGVCGKPLESGKTIHVAGLGPRCYRCFNQEAADRVGIDFDEPDVEDPGKSDTRADGRLMEATANVDTGEIVWSLTVPARSLCRLPELASWLQLTLPGRQSSSISDLHRLPRRMGQVDQS